MTETSGDSTNSESRVVSCSRNLVGGGAERSTQAGRDRGVDAERMAHHLVVDVDRFPDEASLKLSAVLGRHGVRAAVWRPRAEQDRAIDADVLIFERGAVREAC